MAEAENVESSWLTQDTAGEIERQFNRYGINLGSRHAYILHNDNELNWPKWFEGASVNLGFECLDKQNDAAEKIAFGYYENGYDQKITYGELLSKVRVFTESLANRVNLETGRVLIILPTCLEAVISILACLRLGVLFSIMEPDVTHYIYLRLNDFKPHLVITANGCDFDPFLIDSVRSAIGMLACTLQPTSRFVVIRKQFSRNYLFENNAVELNFYHVDPTTCFSIRYYCINKPLCVAYTAGTTGQPKGCVHSALSLYMSCISDDGFIVHPQACNCPVSLFFTDLSNIVGLIGIILKPLLFHVQSILCEAVIENTQPIQIYDLIRFWKVTSAYFSKSALKKLKSKDAEIPKSIFAQDIQLKTVFTSGSEIDEVLAWTRTLFSQTDPLLVYNFYALTELGGIIFTDHSDVLGQPFSRRTTGRLVPFICAKIMRSPRTLGQNELFIKLPLPPMIMISYYENNDLFFRNFYDIELIPKVEQDMSRLDWVERCCVVCKNNEKKKRLYGFFKIKQKYSHENPVKICKEIQGFIRYLHGNFINFEAFDIFQMPVLTDKISIDRILMSHILHDISQADVVKDCYYYESFIAKVIEINQLTESEVC